MAGTTGSSGQIRTSAPMGRLFVRPGAISVIISILLMCTLVLLPFTYVPIGISTMLDAKRKTKRTKQEAERFLRDFIGREPQFIDCGTGGAGTNLMEITGTGIAYADGRLYVLDQGVAAEIPWSQVRSWNWNILGWTSDEGPEAHAPDSTPMVEITRNSVGRITAHRNSGFTIVTKDIHKTDWRFTTIDSAVCKKWMEILRKMDEGALGRR